MGEWTLTPPGEVHEVDTAGEGYGRFRSGETFQTVREALAREQRVAELEGRRMFVTRRTVLGRLHQIKQSSWRAREREWGLDSSHVPDIEGVDFDPGADFF